MNVAFSFAVFGLRSVCVQKLHEHLPEQDQQDV